MIVFLTDFYSKGISTRSTIMGLLRKKYAVFNVVKSDENHRKIFLKSYLPISCVCILGLPSARNPKKIYIKSIKKSIFLIFNRFLIRFLKDFYSKRNIPSPNIIKQRRVSYSYRTATTSYPCYIPVLGDFRGSWSYKTYPMQKYGLLSEWQAKKRLFFLMDEHEADLQ